MRDQSERLGEGGGAVTDEVLEAFAREVGDSGPVAVVGRRTRWRCGGELDDGVRMVEAPTGILDYRPEEMTVRVRAGTTVGELHASLQGAGQRTSLPDHGGTVGGAVAVGEDDLDVLGRGTVRSAVLQMRYVSADGKLVTGGSPTVKNVSGFDIPRLMVGALGTLGLIADVILRTNPIPRTSRWLVSTDADPFATFASLYRPSAVLWDGATTWIHLEGHEPDVEAQQAVVGRSASWSIVDRPDPPAHPLSHRWSLRPADLRSIVQHETGSFVAVVGVGTVHASKPQPARTVSPEMRRLHERTKTEFDPAGRLNPGRDPLAR